MTYVKAFGDPSAKKKKDKKKGWGKAGRDGGKDGAQSIQHSILKLDKLKAVFFFSALLRYNWQVKL